MTYQNIMSEFEMLAQQVLAGDTAAYNTLLQRVGPALRSYFARQFRLGAAADDLTQETLIALHTKFHTYKPDQPFVPWLYAIAKYKAIDYLRANKRRTAASEVPLDDNLVCAPEDAASNSSHDLATLLGQLSARDRTLLQLSKVEGQSLQQISEQLNISLAAVKIGIHRAMKRVMGAASEEHR